MQNFSLLSASHPELLPLADGLRRPLWGSMLRDSQTSDSASARPGKERVCRSPRLRTGGCLRPQPPGAAGIRKRLSPTEERRPCQAGGHVSDSCSSRALRGVTRSSAAYSVWVWMRMLTVRTLRAPVPFPLQGRTGRAVLRRISTSAPCCRF